MIASQCEFIHKIFAITVVTESLFFRICCVCVCVYGHIIHILIITLIPPTQYYYKCLGIKSLFHSMENQKLIKIFYYFIIKYFMCVISFYASKGFVIDYNNFLFAIVIVIVLI